MNFIMVEVLFKYERRKVTIPVINDEGAFCIINCLDKSEEVVAYIVTNGGYVTHKHFGWGPFDKWVKVFTTEMFG